MINLVLLGPPGGGKGSQAKIISEKLLIQHISTGDLIRNEIRAGTEFGNKVKAWVKSGQLVPDEMTLKLLQLRLRQIETEKGFILDGFPRNIHQAKMLVDNNIVINKVIHLSVDDNIIIKRAVGRRIHPKSGRVYNIYYSPPINKGKDDVTGEDLVQRLDDSEEIIMQRLAIYHKEIKSLVDFYKNQVNYCYELNGNNISIKELNKIIIAKLVD